MMFSVLNDILRSVNYGIEQARSNAWYIFLLIISIYLVRDQFKKLSYRASGITLGTSGNSTDRTTKSIARNTREEEMHQARLRQQEILNQKAKEALEQRRELLKKKAMNDDPSSEPKQSNDGKSQTTSTTKKHSAKQSSKTTTSKPKTTPTPGYNPMQPWSASASGGTYRPSRRANPRGGG